MHGRARHGVARWDQERRAVPSSRCTAGPRGTNDLERHGNAGQGRVWHGVGRARRPVARGTRAAGHEGRHGWQSHGLARPGMAGQGAVLHGEASSFVVPSVTAGPRGTERGTGQVGSGMDGLGQPWQGLAGQGLDRLCMAWRAAPSPGEPGPRGTRMDGYGGRGSGESRRGTPWRVRARPGEERLGTVRQGQAWSSVAGDTAAGREGARDWSGTAGSGAHRQGEAWWGAAWIGVARSALDRCGSARHGMAGHGEVRFLGRTQRCVTAVPARERGGYR